AAEDPKSERTRGEKPATTAEIEFDGAEERIVPFPVSSGVFRDLEAVEAGLLWMRAGDAEGGELGSKHAGDTGDKPAEVIQFFDFAKRKLTTVVESADDYEVSGNGKHIVVRNEGDHRGPGQPEGRGR